MIIENEPVMKPRYW